MPMTMTASLMERLREIVGGDALAPEAEMPRYAVDGVVPKAVVFPSSEEQVSAVLAMADRDGWTVAPRGNGSLMELGGTPERVDVVVALGKLRQPIEHSPDDLTVTAGAGTTLAELQQTLAQAGQWLPLDPPMAHQRTLGGILATNLAGPLSLSHGTARDWVIGMRVASPDGTITKSGGKVVKNVTGFDVGKVHLGALGTLGVIVEASLKVAPLPAKDATLTAAFASLEDALKASMSLAGIPGAPQAVEVAVSGDGGCTAYTRLMGSAASVERRLRDARSCLSQAGAGQVEVMPETEATQAWKRLADFGWDAPLPGDSILLRLGCVPSHVMETATVLRDVTQKYKYEAQIVAGVGRGLLRCILASAAGRDAGAVAVVVDELRGRVASLGGYVVVERCNGDLKSRVDVWGSPGEGLSLMRRLKEQMDPKHILNPGRFVGGI